MMRHALKKRAVALTLSAVVFAGAVAASRLLPLKGFAGEPEWKALQAERASLAGATDAKLDEAKRLATSRTQSPSVHPQSGVRRSLGSGWRWEGLAATRVDVPFRDWPRLLGELRGLDRGGVSSLLITATGTGPSRRFSRIAVTLAGAPPGLTIDPPPPRQT